MYRPDQFPRFEAQGEPPPPPPPPPPPIEPPPEEAPADPKKPEDPGAQGQNVQ